MHEVDTIVWQAQFETGIAEIDDQHRVLINTLNEANAQLRVETRPAAIEQLLTDLLAYAIYHFDTEETLMRDFDYAAHDAALAHKHVTQHRQFAAKVARLREQFVATGELDRDALLAFLNHWLTTHILVVDQSLSRFLLQHGHHA